MNLLTKPGAARGEAAPPKVNAVSTHDLKEIIMKTHTVDRNVAATGSSSANNNHTGAFVASHAAGRTAITLVCMLLATSLCLHKNAAAQQSSLLSSGQKAMTAEISVSLDKSVDSKKLKSRRGSRRQGRHKRAIERRNGNLSRGARIVGHVTEAKKAALQRRCRICARNCV